MGGPPRLPIRLGTIAPLIKPLRVQGEFRLYEEPVDSVEVLCAAAQQRCLDASRKYSGAPTAKELVEGRGGGAAVVVRAAVPPSPPAAASSGPCRGSPAGPKRRSAPHRRRHGISLEPSVGTEAVGPCDSDHEVPPAAVRRLPSLHNDRVYQAGFVVAPERTANRPFGLHRERGRGRGAKRRIQPPRGKQAAGASCRPNRPPGGAQVCGMEAAHRRQFSYRRYAAADSFQKVPRARTTLFSTGPACPFGGLDSPQP